MNLRPEGDTGFPKRDDIPAKILADPELLTKIARDDYFSQCCNFFEALFKTIQAEFLQVPQETPTESVDDFIRNWNEDMCAMGSDSRATFFSNVQADYDKVGCRQR
jgi:hypothetical protein